MRDGREDAAASDETMYRAEIDHFWPAHVHTVTWLMITELVVLNLQCHLGLFSAVDPTVVISLYSAGWNTFSNTKFNYNTAVRLQ